MSTSYVVVKLLYHNLLEINNIVLILSVTYKVYKKSAKSSTF